MCPDNDTTNHRVAIIKVIIKPKGRIGEHKAVVGGPGLSEGAGVSGGGGGEGTGCILWRGGEW